MSIALQHIALHQVFQNDVGELKLHQRTEELSSSQFSEMLCDSVHGIFNSKSNLDYCVFNEDSHLKNAFLETQLRLTNFNSFSSQCAEAFVNQMSKYPFADSGSLVITQYLSFNTSYLAVVLVPSNEALKLVEGLEVSGTDYLDTKNIKIGARINITEMEYDLESTKYIQLLSGRNKSLSNFFYDFLDADSGLNKKHQNMVLVQAIDDFTSDSKMDKEERLAFKKQAYNLCHDKINIKELSSDMTTNNDGTSFADYVTEQGYGLEEEFPKHNASLQRLIKLKGSGGGLNITVDALLIDERVFYDPETDTLTIKGTPPALRDQLVTMQ